MKLGWLKGLIILLLLVFTDASYVFSQGKQTGSLRGTIKGSDGAPLPAATVLVVGTNNGTVADIDGNYFVRDITAGQHQIKFSYV
ncbi:MAG: carboxypeptidase-like regulatory domain-containing protein, partial [Candidatus Kryptoniota bacterium]